MKFKTKYFVFVFVCLFLFCELPLQFYLFLILVLGPGASEIVLLLRYFCTQQTWSSWAQTLAGGCGSFAELRKGSSECLEKCDLNCNLSHWEGLVEAWRLPASPAEPKLNRAQVAVVPLWPPTCVLTQPSAPNNSQERTKGCFLVEPWSLTWKGWYLSSGFGQGTCRWAQGQV